MNPGLQTLRRYTAVGQFYRPLFQRLARNKRLSYRQHVMIQGQLDCSRWRLRLRQHPALQIAIGQGLTAHKEHYEQQPSERQAEHAEQSAHGLAQADKHHEQSRIPCRRFRERVHARFPNSGPSAWRIATAAVLAPLQGY